MLASIDMQLDMIAHYNLKKQKKSKTIFDGVRHNFRSNNRFTNFNRKIAFPEKVKTCFAFSENLPRNFFFDEESNVFSPK